MHGSAGWADSDFICVIASQGKMADAMDFCVEWAERVHQQVAYSISSYNQSACGNLEPQLYVWVSHCSIW